MAAKAIIRRLRRLGKDQYELEGLTIVRHRGLWQLEAVLLDQILGWRVDPEMTFDSVTIRLLDGRKVLWLDTYNDLLEALRTKIPERESIAPPSAPPAE